MTTQPVNDLPSPICLEGKCWRPEIQARLDAATTEAELGEIWERLEAEGEADMRGGSEWRHAVAHLHYRQGDGGGAEEDEEDEEPDDEIVRAKWTIDGAATLAEAAQKAHAFGDWLQSLHDEGYVLSQPVSDDYGFYSKPE
jgi:hypothetical protein